VTSILLTKPPLSLLLLYLRQDPTYAMLCLMIECFCFILFILKAMWDLSPYGSSKYVYVTIGPHRSIRDINTSYGKSDNNSSIKDDTR
jgi:hypothetical protein